MKERSLGSKIVSGILTIILIIVLFILWDIYKTNSFDRFIKVEQLPELTSFKRDKDIRYGNLKRSYKIESTNYNDAIFYGEIEVEPETPYKISCMVKTEDVENNVETSDAGAVISIYGSTEISKAVTGTNDWQKLELYVNSGSRTILPVGFRLGGNLAETKGTVWFSDIHVEKGIKETTTNWNVGCYIFNINTDSYQITTTESDKVNIKIDMERFADSCKELSKGKMTVTYEINDMKQAITTLTHTDDYGYNVAPQNVQYIIGDDILEKEYDYVFVVTRMETPEGINVLQSDVNWIGLGKMDLYGVGFSNIRINESYNDIYNSRTNRFPEEVYIHEFLHTLERNLEERNYKFPALHDYEKYGYESEAAISLKNWYADYMCKGIIDKNQNVGLDKSVYNTQPAHKSNFEYAIEVKFTSEPKNMIEDVKEIGRLISEYFRK